MFGCCDVDTMCKSSCCLGGMCQSSQNCSELEAKWYTDMHLSKYFISAMIWLIFVCIPGLFLCIYYQYLRSTEPRDTQFSDLSGLPNRTENLGNGNLQRIGNEHIRRLNRRLMAIGRSNASTNTNVSLSRGQEQAEHEINGTA